MCLTGRAQTSTAIRRTPQRYQVIFFRYKKETILKGQMHVYVNFLLNDTEDPATRHTLAANTHLRSNTFYTLCCQVP